METQYCYSFDEERFEGKFSSIEEALEAAKDEAIDQSDYTGRVGLWIGEAKPIELKYILPNADDIVDQARERVCDAVGELGETYLDDWGFNSKPIAEKINAELPGLIVMLFANHGIDIVPKCWRVLNVKEYVIEIPEHEAA